MTDAGVWRLFLGLWPSPDERSALERNAAAWQWPPAARRTAAERLHITLHFIGNVAVDRLPQLQDRLHSVRWGGCSLLLDRAEVWPGGIAVLEAGRVPPELTDLHARLGQGLASLQLPVESRRFRPHVTLARKAQGARPAPAAAIPWTAGAQVLLLRSLPGGRGYVPVQAFA